MPESVTDRPTRAHEYVFMLAKASRYYFDQEAGREKVGEPVRMAASFRNGGVYTGGRSFDNSGDASKDTHGDGDTSLAGRNMRSVWTIATQPYAEAHFATFPERLVERVLAVACPERVCGECGAPSVRVVEREQSPSSRDGFCGKQSLNGDRKDGGGVRRVRDPSGIGGYTIATGSRMTAGWTDCGHGAYRPGIVLDPFSGSGTTAHVARRMGRRAVGIDLNPEYLALAAKRLRQLSLLGGAA